MIEPPQSLRILYLEDSAADAELTRRELLRSVKDASVDIAPTVATALARLATAATSFDVVLCDLSLPDGSGMEVLEAVRTRELPLAVVILTSSGDQDAAVAALRAGADDYLVKQGDYREHLAQTLQAALARFLAAQARKGRCLRVLYAEHNPFDADLTRIHFSRHASHVRLEIVPSGEQVLERLPTGSGAPPACDVVLLDYQLPGANALSIAKSIRDERGLDLPVVLVTSQGSEESVATALRLGVADYVVKRDGYLAALPAVLERAHQQAELARSEAALQTTSARLQHLLAASPVVLYALRAVKDGARLRFVPEWVSDNVQRVFAYPPEACLQPGWWRNNVHPEDKEQAELDADRLVAEGSLTHEYRFLDGTGEVRWVRDEMRVLIGPDGAPTEVVGSWSDLTRLKKSEADLEHLAHHDPLTGLPNRLLLQSSLQRALERAAHHATGAALFVLNVDQFKTVNESLGHTLGDELLRAVARRFHERLRPEDMLARLGGDEFAVVIEPLDDPVQAETLGRRLLDALEQPFLLSDGHETYVRASIGIGIYPDDGRDVAELLRQADTAMHRAKEQGGHQLAFYTSTFNAHAVERLELEVAMRRGLERGEYELHYQPKVDLTSGLVTGAEALLRWRHPSQGLVPPGSFIAAAERSGLIVPIGAYVIDEACRQMAAWREAGLRDLGVAVNVSARQFAQGDLEELVRGSLERHGVEPGRLELELTESMLMEAPERAIERLAALKRAGVRLSLDDFGTGYSSLGYLSRFPVDHLKIDRGFVEGVATEPNAAAIATSVIALAHRMGLRVVAEGVETEAQLAYLRRHGCDEMQGYYFSPPLRADDFAALIREGRTLATPEPAESSRTLLLVDDEPNILSAVRRCLRSEPYRILNARNASEGLALLASNEIQVILCDQRMPGMSGTEFFGRVKALHPDTVRIVLSGYTELETIIQAINAGAIYKFLTKPWDDEQLRAQIRDAFRYHEAVVRPRGGAA